MIGRAFREATRRLRRRPSGVVERVEAYTVEQVALRPIVGGSGEFVGWMRKDAA